MRQTYASEIGLAIVLYKALKDKIYDVTPPITNGKPPTTPPPANGNGTTPPPKTGPTYFRADGLYTWVGYLYYVDQSASNTDYQDYLTENQNGNGNGNGNGYDPGECVGCPTEFRADLTVSDTIAYSSPCPIGYRAVEIPRGYSTQSRCYNGP